MAKISLYLKPETEQDIKLLANFYNLKISAIIDKAITAFIANEAKALEFARKQEQERENFIQNSF